MHVFDVFGNRMFDIRLIRTILTFVPFFFFEDIDLCKRIKKMKESIFVFNKIKIFHEGAKGINPNINQNRILNH